MKEKETLLAQLEQNQNDRQKLQEEADRLLKAIEDTEPTYSVGDRFKRGGNKYILAIQIAGNNAVALVCLKDGCLWSGEHEVKNVYCITSNELSKMSTVDVIRYWDSQKQELV